MHILMILDNFRRIEMFLNLAVKDKPENFRKNYG